MSPQPPAQVPPCGRVGCFEREAHNHQELDGWGPGDRIVAEAKRSTAPGWVWQSPHGTVMSRARFVQLTGLNVVTVLFDDGVTRDTPVDLLTKWHAYRRRGTPAPRPKLLPRLPRTHRLDGDITEPTLPLGDAS
jgi:hypothetical protein